MKTAIIRGLALAAIGLAACSRTPGERLPQVGATIGTAGASAAFPPGDPVVLPPVPDGDRVSVHLTLVDRTLGIAPGMRYQTWTFNGTVPGPVVHARVGQTIEVTLTNRSAMGHSIDFHSALAPPDVAYQTIQPGKTIHFEWVAKDPGVFLYHCGTPPVLMHISNGMYGAVIVDPEHGWPDGPMLGYVLLQSEFYTQAVPGSRDTYRGDFEKARRSMPDVVAFNGYAMQYLRKPVAISVGNPVRLFVVNAGPSHFSAFHVIGTIMETTYVGGNPANALHGLQTVSIPPGDGALTEFKVRQRGRYPFVTHSFGDADLGAMGAFVAEQ